MHVQHSEKCIWIAFYAFRFDGSANRWLCEDELGKVMEVKEVRVELEKLRKETLERVVVYSRVWVEELKIDVDEALCMSTAQ
jgi:hypothetical protein